MQVQVAIEVQVPLKLQLQVHVEGEVEVEVQVQVQVCVVLLLVVLLLLVLISPLLVLLLLALLLVFVLVLIFLSFFFSASSASSSSSFFSSLVAFWPFFSSLWFVVCVLYFPPFLRALSLCAKNILHLARCIAQWRHNLWYVVRLRLFINARSLIQMTDEDEQQEVFASQEPLWCASKAPALHMRHGGQFGIYIDNVCVVLGAIHHPALHLPKANIFGGEGKCR